MTTTGNGVADELARPMEDGEDAFLNHLLQKDAFKEPSDKKKRETKDQQPTDDHEDEDEASEQDAPEDAAEDEESDGEDKTEEKARKYVDVDDTTFIKVKVGDEEHELPLKDLQRLAGQEAALTRKSQETAAARKKADEDTATAVTALDVLLQRAQEKLKPYTELDFFALSRRDDISDAELAGLRQAAQVAYEEVQFLSQERDRFVQAFQKAQHENRVAASRECLKQLTTAPTEKAPNPNYIEGWSDQLYDDIRGFAISQGLSPEIVNSVTDAPAIKLMHMAMLYSRGAQKVQTKKVDKTPKKIIKSNKSSEPSTAKADTAKNAMTKLRRTGSEEDAANVFLSRFRHSDSE